MSEDLTIIKLSSGAKIQINSSFGGIFSIMEQFETTLSSDSTLGLRLARSVINLNRPFPREYLLLWWLMHFRPLLI